MARRPSRIRGDKGFRKLIRQVPESARLQISALLARLGADLLRAMQADVPVRTGALRATLKAKLLRASLRLRVGLINKADNRRLFYGRIVEFGRKGKVVTTRPGRVKRSYKMRVREMAPRPFVFASRRELRSNFSERIRLFWDDTLAQAAQGTGNDD